MGQRAGGTGVMAKLHAAAELLSTCGRAHDTSTVWRAEPNGVVGLGLGRSGAAPLRYLLGDRAHRRTPASAPGMGRLAGGPSVFEHRNPVDNKALAVDPIVTVHLESGTEVVIVEGRFVGASSDTRVLTEYDRKYDWNYEPGRDGPISCVAPETVLAWRTAGWAGRESFQRTGRWNFS